MQEKIVLWSKKLAWKMIATVAVVLTAGGTFWAMAAFVEPTASPASSVQDFVQNILGANNNNNSFDSSSVVSNADGSLIERAEYLQARVKLPKTQYFSGSGTFTVPSGVATVWVTAWGGGGAGGGGTYGTPCIPGGGGGAGQIFFQKAVDVSGLAGGTAPVVIGAAGGNTTFSTLITAYGGVNGNQISGGAGSAKGGLGGIRNVQCSESGEGSGFGRAGDSGGCQLGYEDYSGGGGAGGFQGRGGSGGYNAVGSAADANSGAGGGGGGCNATTSRAGGAGGTGGLIVEWFE